MLDLIEYTCSLKRSLCSKSGNGGNEPIPTLTASLEFRGISQNIQKRPKICRNWPCFTVKYCRSRLGTRRQRQRWPPFCLCWRVAVTTCTTVVGSILHLQPRRKWHILIIYILISNRYPDRCKLVVIILARLSQGTMLKKNLLALANNYP